MAMKKSIIKQVQRELQNSHRDVKYSRGNIDNNIVKTMYGASWVLEILGEGGRLYKVYDCLVTTLYT